MIPRILKPLEAQLEGFVLHKITIGKSGAGVWHATRGRTNWFIKAQKNTVELEQEAKKMRWFAAQGIQVPAVINYLETNNTAFLITEALQGTDASRANNPRATTIALAHFLRHLHNLKITDCPFDRTLNTSLEIAKHNLHNGFVDETDFDLARLGIPVPLLYQRLLAERPNFEDLVLTHGDFCLPNIILEQNSVSGIIDLGRAGIADRYQDIALILRSMESEMNPRFHGCTDIFAHEYGMNFESDKLEYYQLLDEFF